MSGTSFKGYTASKLRVELKTDSLEFTDSDGDLTADIVAIPDTELALSKLQFNVQDMFEVYTQVDADNSVQFSINRPYSTTDFSSAGNISMAVSCTDSMYGAKASLTFDMSSNAIQIGHVDHTGAGLRGQLSLDNTDIELLFGNIYNPLGRIYIGDTDSANKGIELFSGGGVQVRKQGIGIGAGNSLNQTYVGTRQCIQLATDTAFGGTFDNHSGYLIYSTMATGWGYSELHFVQSNNWGSYDENSTVIFQRGGAILVKGGSSSGYTIRNIDTSQGSRPTMLYGRTGSTSGAWVTVTHASNVFKSIVTNNEQGIATKFQNVTSTSFQVSMSGTATGTVDWVRCGQV
jgi:hypothetical protein